MLKILLGLPILFCLQQSVVQAAERAPLKRFMSIRPMRTLKPAPLALKNVMPSARHFSTGFSAHVINTLPDLHKTEKNSVPQEGTVNDAFINACYNAQVRHLPNIKRKHPEMADSLDKINLTFFIIRNCRQAKIEKLDFQILEQLIENFETWSLISQDLDMTNDTLQECKREIDKLFELSIELPVKNEKLIGHYR